MLTTIEVLNYRALRCVRPKLKPFHVLVGPNASGKSTFLDVIALAADIIRDPSPVESVRRRAADLRDLTWMGSSDWLEFALEVELPAFAREQLDRPSHERLRYEVRIGAQEDTAELALLSETLWFVPGRTEGGEMPRQPRLFPSMLSPLPIRITRKPGARIPSGWRKIVNKIEQSGNDYFRSETTDWSSTFRLGPKRSALANLPEDELRFPAATWFKRYISEGVQRIMLNSEAMRRPSPPQSPRTFLPDGSNLPWVVYSLELNHPDRLRDWIEHVKTALPDLKDIRTIERPEDRHRYLILEYDTGLGVPSWSASDGTLRMLALTILAYLPGIEGIYLIEEPENGIHPRAVETVFKSLQSVYDAQVLMATHSPVILSLTEPEQLLCFARTPEGETDIVPGHLHPRLQDWRGEVNLSALFAGGVLG